MLKHKICIAPMMDWSDRHCRFFWRLISKNVFLYTEMVTTGALIHGDRQRFLQFNREETPVALQLGGSQPTELAQCANWAEQWGYNEVNLNCGCPSDRVQSGMFGACLMAKPELVADCVKAMQDSCDISVTVKHRIGIDDMETYEQMLNFVDIIAATGCNTFIVHARKAWLQGLSPKQNREIPPLNYDWVYRLKRERPELEIIINGGIDSLDSCEGHLQQVDGVMLGRSAYNNPYLLNDVDAQFFTASNNVAGRDDILLSYIPYIESQLSMGCYLNSMTRHVLGLYKKVPGAKIFRRHISQNATKPGAGTEVLVDALELVKQARLEIEKNDRTLTITR
jgi:tRNA-dihydrouridine synthase A